MTLWLVMGKYCARSAFDGHGSEETFHFGPAKYDEVEEGAVGEYRATIYGIEPQTGEDTNEFFSLHYASIMQDITGK